MNILHRRFFTSIHIHTPMISMRLLIWANVHKSFFFLSLGYILSLFFMDLVWTFPTRKGSLLWCPLGLKAKWKSVNRKILESLSRWVGKFRLGKFPLTIIQIYTELDFLTWLESSAWHTLSSKLSSVGFTH